MCEVTTNKYFVICSNVIGGCSGSTGPQSIDPDTGKPYNMDFPVITVADMVRAQKQLVDHLGITKLLAVLGGFLIYLGIDGTAREAMERKLFF